MKRMQTSGVIAVCLGMLACGDAGTQSDEGNATSGQTAANGNNAGNGADSSGLKDGDPVDLDGDGQKDDGVAVDVNGDGKVDGVDTNGDGKVDAPLPGGSSGNSGGSNGTTTPDTDGAVNEPLACDGVGVCDDNFKDTCDGTPDNCPTTQSAGIDEPTWDCAGEPPTNVYAYAKFPEGTAVASANLAPGACVAFFEGAKDLFYAKWFKFGPKMVTDKCATYDGCICPKGTIFDQSYDRRLYAFTWDGDDKCAPITIVDHQGRTVETALNQPVSNTCRKYLYALHTEGNTSIEDGQDAYDLPFSYVASGLAALKKRLSDFPRVEVACMEVQTAGPLPWAQLMVSDVKTNAGFKKKN